MPIRLHTDKHLSHVCNGLKQEDALALLLFF